MCLKKTFKKKKIRDSGGGFQHSSHCLPLGNPPSPCRLVARLECSVLQLGSALLLLLQTEGTASSIQPLRPQTSLCPRVWGPRERMVVAKGLESWGANGGLWGPESWKHRTGTIGKTIRPDSFCLESPFPEWPLSQTIHAGWWFIINLIVLTVKWYSSNCMCPHKA